MKLLLVSIFDTVCSFGNLEVSNPAFYRLPGDHSRKLDELWEWKKPKSAVNPESWFLVLSSKLTPHLQ